jgi:hypothetical protein
MIVNKNYTKYNENVQIEIMSTPVKLLFNFGNFECFTFYLWQTLIFKNQSQILTLMFCLIFCGNYLLCAFNGPVGWTYFFCVFLSEFHTEPSQNN